MHLMRGPFIYSAMIHLIRDDGYLHGKMLGTEF